MAAGDVTQCSDFDPRINNGFTEPYYTTLQKEIEILRPFVWLQFNDTSVGQEFTLALDHKDYADTNKFRFMKRFEHKLFSVGGEAVQIVFFDEGGRTLPNVLKSILTSVTKAGNLSKDSRFWILFQYGWDSSYRMEYEKKIVFKSKVRQLIITKCDIAIDEGGMTYTLTGVDYLAVLQMNVPIQQYSNEMPIHELFNRIAKDNDNFDFCATEDYMRLYEQDPKRFKISNPHNQSRNVLEFMRHWCDELSSAGSFRLYVTFDSKTQSQADPSSGGFRPIVQLHIVKSEDPEMFSSSNSAADIKLLPGWPQKGIVVNGYEHMNNEGGRGGVVREFKPQIAMNNLFSNVTQVVSAKPEERATASAKPHNAKGGDPEVKSNDLRREGMNTTMASPKIDNLQNTSERISSLVEVIDGHIRSGGSAHLSGFSAELECLGMPLYDDRFYITGNLRHVKIDYQMPYYIGDKVLDRDNMFGSDIANAINNGDWISLVGNNTSTDMLISGYWFIKDISHRIDEASGYSTVYSLSKYVPPGTIGGDL